MVEFRREPTGAAGGCHRTEENDAKKTTNTFKALFAEMRKRSDQKFG
jgi:hypothetical protein